MGATATLQANQIAGVVAATGITASPPITQVVLSITGNSPGAFVPGGGALGNLGGAMPMAGTALIKAYSGLVTLVGVPLTPLGNPGATVMTVTGGAGIINVAGSGWTTGLRTLMVPATTTAGCHVGWRCWKDCWQCLRCRYRRCRRGGTRPAVPEPAARSLAAPP